MCFSKNGNALCLKRIIYGNIRIIRKCKRAVYAGRFTINMRAHTRHTHRLRSRARWAMMRAHKSFLSVDLILYYTLGRGSPLTTHARARARCIAAAATVGASQHPLRSAGIAFFVFYFSEDRTRTRSSLACIPLLCPCVCLVRMLTTLTRWNVSHVRASGSRVHRVCVCVCIYGVLLFIHFALVA